MTTALHVKSVTKTALIAALMCGSSLVAAQDATTAAPAPVAEVPSATPAPVTPPPIVRTLPTTNDVVNPAASQQVADEQQAKTAPVAVARMKAPTRVQPAGVSKVKAAAEVAKPVAASEPDPVATATSFNEPSSNVPSSESVSGGVAGTDGANDASETATAVDNGADDLPLFGGIAAALAALGLGGLFIARRKRGPIPTTVESNKRHVGPAHVAPAAPVARTTMTPALAPAAPVAPAPVLAAAVAQQYSAQPPRERPQVDRRSDIPVTDPLFSTPVVAGPITDPMFAPRNDVQTPITDPLFAKYNNFVGRLGDIRPTPTPEPVK